MLQPALAVDHDGITSFIRRRTVELVAPRPGEAALDVMTGEGASVPALAAMVRPGGRVVACDSSAAMATLARERVAEDDVEVLVAGARDLPWRAFDVITCDVALFHAPDMPLLVRSMARRLAPGGRLAIGVLGEQFAEPLLSLLGREVERECPGLDLHRPWARTETVSALTAVTSAAGLTDVALVEAEECRQLDASEWRRVVAESPLRRTLSMLGAECAERVMRRCDRAIPARTGTTVRTTARWAVVRVP